MGNSCFLEPKGLNYGVYLHWNGGRDSINAFLAYCKLRQFNAFNSTNGYGVARFCQVVSNFFSPDGHSIGIESVKHGNGDNGIYIVDGWEIVGREDYNRKEQHEYDLQEMLVSIDESQPVEHQLGAYLTATQVKRNTLQLGDYVYHYNALSVAKAYPIVGFGLDQVVNGRNVLAIPYINKYSNDNPENNINNYIFDDMVRTADKNQLK